MPRRDRTPAPYDVIIGGVGFVEARAGGAPQANERVPLDRYEAYRTAEDSLVLEDFSGGAGVRWYTAAEPTRHSLYFAASTDQAGAAGESFGGGADGAYGPLLPGPYLHATAVGGGSETVRCLREFTPSGGTQCYLAGIENKVYRSTSPVWASSSAVVTLPTSSAQVRRLVPYAGTNGMLRAYALNAHDAMYSSLDGSTWARIGVRTESPSVFLTTTDGGASYTDATANVTGAGTASLSSLGTLADLDWVLVGHTHPFLAANWTLTNTNGNASVATVEFWTGTAWAGGVTLGSANDTTLDAGHTKTLNASGIYTWNHPSVAWVPSPLVELGAAGSGPSLSQSYFWVRISFSAALDGSVDVDTVTLNVYQEGLCGAVLQDQFAVVGPDSRTIYWTRTGGATPTWLSNFDPLPAGGTALDMVAVNGTWWVLGTNHLSAVGPDGSIHSYFPELFQGGAADTDTAFMTVWLGKILFTLGQGRGLFLLDPSTGGLEVIGPERQFLDDTAVAPYVTAVVGDRTHRLYAGWKTAGDKAWLAAWGAYRQGQGSSGQAEYERVDAWHQLGDLSTGRTVTSAAVWTASGQPYVALGDTTGRVFAFKTSIGAGPLLAGSGYEWSTRTVTVHLAAYAGADPARRVEAYASTLQARNLGGGRGVTIGSRDFTTGGSYTAQAAAVVASGATRQAWTAPYSGYGLETALTCTMASDVATPWIVDRVLLHQQAEVLDSQMLATVTVLVDDDVVAQDGRVLPFSASDWRAKVDTLMASKVPLAVVRASGQTEYMLPRSRSQDELRPDRFGNRKRAVTLTLASAEGAPN